MTGLSHAGRARLRDRGQAGAVLAGVLAFTLVATMLLLAVLSFALTGTRAAPPYRERIDKVQLNSDAMNFAIQAIRNDITKGTQGHSSTYTYGPVSVTCVGDLGSGVAQGEGRTDRTVSCETPAPAQLRAQVRFFDRSARAEATAMYRINVGGPAITGQPVWSEDSTASPSPLRVGIGGGNIATTSTLIDTSHPSVPAGTPMSLFQTDRWDPSDDHPMRYSFPTDPGEEYKVTLFFSENNPPSSGRKFDVFLEDVRVLDNFERRAAAGNVDFKGIAQSFTVTSDGAIDLRFAHRANNPSVQGISITPMSGGLAGLIVEVLNWRQADLS